MGCLWWRSRALLALGGPEVHKHLCSHLHFGDYKVLSPGKMNSEDGCLVRTKEMEIFMVPTPLRPRPLTSAKFFHSLCSGLWAEPQVLTAHGVDQTRSLGLIPEFLRNAEPWAPPQARWVEMQFHKLLGGFICRIEFEEHWSNIAWPWPGLPFLPSVLSHLSCPVPS